jgi:hypothetical protein
MILDRNLLFSQAQTLAIAVGSAASTDVVDLGGVAIPGSAAGGGARDIAPGRQLALLAQIITAATSGGAGTLTLALQGAPDNGSGVPGSYTTMWTSPTFALATMIAGAQLANIMVPRPVPGQALPRFLRMNYTVATADLTGGTITAGIVLDRFDQPMQANAVVGAYPAGLNVAN